MFKKYREREAAEITGTRSGRKYNETYKGAKMMPLLVEGTQLKNVSWGGRYVETLKSKLPSLRDGANRWIVTFEDETVGDMITVGDIKLLLSKVLTRQEMEDILDDAGMKDAVGCEDYNGQSLNTDRAELWGTLRDKFPTKMSKSRQLTKPLTTEDNLDQWINEQVQHWRNMTNENVTFVKYSLCAQLFRSAVKEVLPVSVQGKLRDILGLDEMDHDHWSIKIHQEAEQALEKQSREVSRKLA